MTLILAPFVYTIAEMITALAWTNPRYDYIYNFVSDLGVPDRGRSPSNRQ